MIRLVLTFSSLFVPVLVANSQTDTLAATYCDGEGCPTKYMIEGFEVRIAASVEAAPDFSNGKLGSALDVLQARLIAFEQSARRKNFSRLAISTPTASKSATVSGIFPHPTNQLRSAGVSFYIQPEIMIQDEYSNCSTPCYISTVDRIVLPIDRLTNLGYADLLITHELAHAYHDAVMEDGWENACVLAAYENSVTQGGLYRSVRNDRYAIEPGNSTVHALTENYGATSAQEYFAVGTETYLAGRAWNYPYNRADLLDYDLTGFSLQWGTWEVNNPEIALSSECGLLSQIFGATHPTVIQEPAR